MDNQTANIITNDKIRDSLHPEPSLEKIASDFAEKVKPLYFTTDELLQALYFIFDAASRGQLGLFITGENAKQVKADADLQGDKLTLGIRRNEWTSGQGRIFSEFLLHYFQKDIKEEDGYLNIVYKGVPIAIKIYKENPTIIELNPVNYRYETFSLPNPLDEFLEKYV